MANLRILYENQADKTATLVANTEAGTYVANNLKTDIKSDVHRTTGLTSILTLTWTDATLLNMACLAFANLTSTATMRVDIYTNVADAVPALATGASPACQYQPFGLWKWGMLPLGSNAFRYGGSVYGRHFFAPTWGKKMVITISDPANALGYIEAGRLITGAYWEPACNPAYGARLRVQSNTTHRRSEAGDLRTPRKPKNRAIEMELPWIAEEDDQFQLWEILMGNGQDRPMYVSLFPEDDNPAVEQQHQLWCKMNGDGELSHPKYGLFAVPLELAEV